MPADLPLLSIGDSGQHVKTVQSILRSQGFFEGSALGNFQTKTKAAVIAFQQSHIGPTKKPLRVDGVVGKDTWWALLNPSGEAQKSNIIAATPSGIPAMRRKILDVALREHKLGVRETPDGSNWGGGVTKYLTNVGPAPWCCYFVSWCVKQATGEYPMGERYGHVLTMWNAAKNRTLSPIRLARKAYKPLPGDIFVMLYRNSSGKLTGSGHTGFVVDSDADGDEFNTVAGNEANRVKVGARDQDQSTLVGFINLFADNFDYARKFVKASAAASDFSSTR